MTAPEHYINRELSFLAFNLRVLAQVHDLDRAEYQQHDQENDTIKSSSPDQDPLPSVENRCGSADLARAVQPRAIVPENFFL